MKFAGSGILLMFVLPLLLCSCVDQQFVKEPAAEADPVLIIYRPLSHYLTDTPWEFTIDKENLVIVEDGTYAKITIAPGTHEIISGSPKDINQPPMMIMVDAVKGRTVYVKYETRFAGSPLMNIIDKPKFNNRFCEMDEQRAQNDLKDLTPGAETAEKIQASPAP